MLLIAIGVGKRMGDRVLGQIGQRVALQPSFMPDRRRRARRSRCERARLLEAARSGHGVATDPGLPGSAHDARPPIPAPRPATADAHAHTPEPPAPRRTLAALHRASAGAADPGPDSNAAAIEPPATGRAPNRIRHQPAPSCNEITVAASASTWR